MLPRRTTSKRVPRLNKRSAQKAERNTVSRPSSHDWSMVRLWLVGAFFAVLGLGLWGRAFYLQVVMGPEYGAMAKDQYTAIERLTGMRGSLLDRNGNIMARSVVSRSVWADPALIKDKKGTAEKLAKVLNQPVSKISSLLQGEKKRFAWLGRKLDYNVAEEVKALALPGIFLLAEHERVYPYKHLAGQLLGFVNIDEKGIEGLENSLEDRLAGRKMRQQIERDASGRRMATGRGGSKKELRGDDIRLTIDTQVQFFAEEALAEYVDKYGAKWGGSIVVDVPTGEILAWAQYPFFNPNDIAATPAGHRRNRLATDMLEQGSTIKSFLIAAALEEGIVNPETIINCEKGSWRFRNVTFHDTRSYGDLPVNKILHVSSNIGVAKIGLKLGAAKYRDYLVRLGFGHRTSLPLAGEAEGQLRGIKKWTEVDLATASFGQGFSTTMVQMAQAYMYLANDGVKKNLRLVLDDDPEAAVTQEGEKIFSQRTMAKVRSMMRGVVDVDGGTGRHARISGIDVGGKTGTAQKADGSGRYGKGRVGSFVGIVPIENPQYLICVLLDEPTKNPYGGTIAAPVFRHVALRTMAYHGLLPEAEEMAAREAAKKLEVAVAKSQARGQIQGQAQGQAQGQTQGQAQNGAQASTPVRASSPAVKQLDEVQKALHSLAADGAKDSAKPQVQRSTKVPSVLGMGLRRAVEELAMEGIVPEINGQAGVVVRQTPEPGKSWPDSERKCILWLEERTL